MGAGADGGCSYDAMNMCTNCNNNNRDHSQSNNDHCNPTYGRLGKSMECEHEEEGLNRVVHSTSSSSSLLSSSSSTFQTLQSLLTTGEACVGILGLGYVGLPLALILYKHYNLIAYDIDIRKIQSIRRGESYIRTIPSEKIQSMQNHEKFHATNQVSDLKRCHVFIMCLPTPLGNHKEPDMSFIFKAAQAIGGIMQKGSLIILESTVYPGATDTELVNILESYSKYQTKLDEIFVVYSPERENPGGEWKTIDIPKLVGGINKKSGEIGKEFYKHGGFKQIVLVENNRIAECSKLLENIYRSVNIALVNELKEIFEDFNVNIWKVLEAANTKPFGYERFNPGPGIGGHCIPIDPFYLSWKAKEFNRQCNFIQLAGFINSEMPKKIVFKIQDILNQQMKKSIHSSHILLLGIAYKPNVDDLREAPSLHILNLLIHYGAHVDYHDPFIPFICQTRKYPNLSHRKSVPFTQHVIQSNNYDIIVIITDHTVFGNYEPLKHFHGIVIDTRNALPSTLQVKRVFA